MTKNALNLTEASVRDAAPGEHIDTKVPYLRLYVTAKSKQRSFGVYEWSPVKKYAVRKTLGKWPAMTVEAARKLAPIEVEKILAGEIKAPPEAPKESTLGELVRDYTLRCKERGARCYDWIESTLERGCKDWWTKPLSAIRKTDIERLHANIAANRGKTVAAQTVKALRTIFNFAIDNEDEPYSGKNTARAVKLPKEQPRQRVLSAEETRKVMAALDWDGFYPWVRPYFKLLLLTGVRKMNLASAEWSEFDLERGVWTIPAEKSKNKKTMEIILRPEAVEILKERLDLDPVHVFASRKRGTSGGHMKDAGPVWKKVLGRAGISSRTTVHDIRRTYGSTLVNAGVPITVVAKAMGHEDARTTMKHYAHVQSATVRDALMRVGAF